MFPNGQSPNGGTPGAPSGPPGFPNIHLIPSMLKAFSNLPKRAAVPRPPAKPARRPPGKLEGQEFYDALKEGTSAADAQLKSVMKKIRNASLEGRELLERGWWQKLLYCNGRQWIYYSPRGGWVDKRMAKWVPRPVTNKCAETVQTIRSLLQSSQPTTRCRPATEGPTSLIAAQMIDDIEPLIAEEHGMDAVWYEADFWGPATGTVFLHPYWDRENRSRQIYQQSMQCPECGYLVHPADVDSGAMEGCPECGMPSDSFQPGVDESGQAIGEFLPLGAGATDVVSCLEIMIPTYYQRWEDVNELIRLRWRPKSWYEGRPYEDKISYTSTTGDRGLQMFRALAMLNDLNTIPFQWGGATPTRTEGAIEAELWIKPSEQYPDGLWARTVGGLNGETLIVRDPDRGVMPGPLPWRDTSGKPLWLWCYLPYESTGGRLWAKSALDPIIQKQDALNRNDSMVELIMQRMANPIWLEPKGAEVQRFTGEPGLIARYSVIAGSSAKPERLEGMSPQGAFFQLRAQHISDMELLAGTQDVLKGIQPGGVEAFSALNLLVERSQSRFTPILKNRGRCHLQWYKLAVELERSYGPEQRVKAIAGSPGSWTFKVFRNENLQGEVDILVEDGSERPKTALGMMAGIQQASSLGAVDPKGDPGVQLAILETVGVPEIAPTLDGQTKAAKIRQNLYEQWVAKGRPPGPPMPGPPMVPGGPPGPMQPTSGNPLKCESWMDHTIYVRQLDLWASSESVRMLMEKDPAVSTEITLYRVQHLVALQNPFGIPAPMQPPPIDPPKTTVTLQAVDLGDPIVQSYLRMVDPAIQLGTPPGAPGGMPPGRPAVMPPGARPMPGPFHGRPAQAPNAQGGRPVPPAAAGPARPAQGAQRALINSNRESGHPDTLPGQAPGGGGMAPPA